MTPDEAEYQRVIRSIDREGERRERLLIDALVTQPPIRVAKQAVREFAEWALAQGAMHSTVIRERLRRKSLASQQPRSE